jgi:hypothetical protein
MAGNSAWVRMERLLEIGFTHEKLLEEIMSTNPLRKG